MGGAICLLRTHGNTSCIASVLVCVINTILHVAYNSLDMLRIIALLVFAILLVFHFSYLFSFFPLLR